jgi:dihydroxy-acid dehydratase
MMPGPGFSTAVKCYETIELVDKGKMSEQQSEFYKRNACSSCGACQYMGTASTMQVMAEALGLSLPGNALMPAWSSLIGHFADQAGGRILKLIDKKILPADILSPGAFENAITVHAAVSGSTNALLHLPAIGHVTPEAAAGGPLALVEDGDLISIDIPGQSLEIVGFDNKRREPEAVERKLRERKAAWKGFDKKPDGVLGLFTKMAGDTQYGASMLGK